MEPVEGQEEGCRLAGVSGLLLRPVRPGNHLTVLKCFGVASIVAFGNEFAPIPEVEIESSADAGQQHAEVRPCSVHQGRRDGSGHPWPAGRGRRTSVRKGAKARLVLSVDLIGQAVSVEVDAGDVQAF